MLRSRTGREKTLQKIEMKPKSLNAIEATNQYPHSKCPDKFIYEVNGTVMEKAKNNRTRLVTVRLTKEEYQQLEAKFKVTTCRKMSDYIRKVLLTGKVTVLTRDQSLDDFMTKMILLRNELSAIGSNFNQAVHKLHLLDKIPEFRTWILLYEVDKQTLLIK